MATGIELRALSKTYAGAAAPAVDGVDLTVAPGEVFFVLGPSGCGKSTLLRMIAGLVQPTAGAVRFADGAGAAQDVTGLAAERRGVGVVFQSYALWPGMSVERNVGFGLEVGGVPKREARRRVAEALAAVRMEGQGARRPGELSGGQQQRVALARALVVRPRVLLLDEPLSNLDGPLRAELRREVRRVCGESGLTAVYVTHDRQEALSTADRAAVMRSGRIEQVGTPRQLYRAPATRFVAEFLGQACLLEGEVDAADAQSGRLTVRTALGPLVAERAGLDRLRAGAPVTLCLRPEAVALTWGDADRPGGHGGHGGWEGASRIAAVVESITYLGEMTRVGLRASAARGVEGVGGKEGGVALCAALVHPAQEPAEGAQAQVWVRPSDVIVIPG